ncbi:MAG: hypothetical protein AAF203_09920 [Pseudomonadota bacterium]
MKLMFSILILFAQWSAVAEDTSWDRGTGTLILSGPAAHDLYSDLNASEVESEDGSGLRTKSNSFATCTATFVYSGASGWEMDDSTPKCIITAPKKSVLK